MNSSRQILFFIAMLVPVMAALHSTPHAFLWASLLFLLLGAACSWWDAAIRSRNRERVLQSALTKLTQARDRDSSSIRERDRILEMIFSNKPVGSILEVIVQLVRSQCPDALCAVLLKQGDRCAVVCTPDLPGEWLAALKAPRALPFNLWREPLENQRPQQDPNWRTFQASLAGATAPALLQSLPIGDPNAILGALVLFYPTPFPALFPDLEVARVAERLARLALEHSHRHDELNFHAHYDSLTGLPNRLLLEERLSRSLLEATVLGQHVAIICLDLDQFKQINNSYSRQAGDLVLRELARRLKDSLRPGDTLARLENDRFAVLLNNLVGDETPSDVRQIAERMMEAVRQPYSIDGSPLLVTASAGIAIFPEDGKEKEPLLRAVSAARTHARNLGGDRVEAFATRNETLDRVRIEEELRLGLRDCNFLIHYQPKVGIDREIVGFEALVRLNHPEHGLIAPGTFIPVAEETGLIVPLGAWVLEEVCRQTAEWYARGLGRIRVAVNVSPVQISRPDFAKNVEDCLKRHGIPPSDLELELTESLLIRATGVAQAQLQALRELGIQLSLDDFGTGYSSLSYLHRLRIDAIKLDKSFVQSIETDALAQNLVQAMIGVARCLGLKVVAEGVETEGQRDALLAAGCALMQGFLFARPQPARDLEASLLSNALEAESARNTAASTQDLLELAAAISTRPPELASPVHDAVSVFAG